MTDPTGTLDDGNGGITAKWPLIAGAALIIAALVTALLLITNSDDDESNNSASTIAVSATTTDVASTPAAPPIPDASKPAVWPWTAATTATTRYVDPVEAATGFATDFLGFTEPLVGEFQAGDNRSGEVEIRASNTGPITTVFVRQLTADDSWWILGAASENITISEPETGTEVTSPIGVSGSAVAFEGTVDVELRADGNGEPIFEGFVTAGATSREPFAETFDFTSPGAVGGALVLQTFSSEDGSLIEASVLRIFYR
jgi:hypothetical protein